MVVVVMVFVNLPAAVRPRTMIERTAWTPRRTRRMSSSMVLVGEVSAAVYVRHFGAL